VGLNSLAVHGDLEAGATRPLGLHGGELVFPFGCDLGVSLRAVHWKCFDAMLLHQPLNLRLATPKLGCHLPLGHPAIMVHLTELLCGNMNFWA
jgi:hypothetical protein